MAATGRKPTAAALYETATNPQVKWRAGARHEIVLIADNVPHTPNVNEDIPAEFWLENPFETGEEPPANLASRKRSGKKGNPWSSTRRWKLDEEEKPLAMVDYFHTGESEAKLHPLLGILGGRHGRAGDHRRRRRQIARHDADEDHQRKRRRHTALPARLRTHRDDALREEADDAPTATATPAASPGAQQRLHDREHRGSPNGTVSITFVPTQAGTGTLVVTVPTASIASASATDAKAKRCKPGQVKIKRKCLPSTTTAGEASASGTAGVPLTLTVSLSGKIKAQLKKGKTIHLTATLTYTSSLGGTPTVQTSQVTVKGKRPHHHR